MKALRPPTGSRMYTVYNALYILYKVFNSDILIPPREGRTAPSPPNFQPFLDIGTEGGILSTTRGTMPRSGSLVKNVFFALRIRLEDDP